MKSFWCLISALACAITTARSEEPKPSANYVTVTFFVENVHCSSCAETIKDFVFALPGIGDIELDEDHPFALVKFDPRRVSHHQIAQAMVNSDTAQGAKYDPTLRLVVPQYAEGDHAAKLDALFAQHKDLVRLEVLDKAKGELAIHFRPLKMDPSAKEPQGWHLDSVWSALASAPPQGLGLAARLIAGKR